MDCLRELGDFAEGALQGEAVRIAEAAGHALPLQRLGSGLEGDLAPSSVLEHVLASATPHRSTCQGALRAWGWPMRCRGGAPRP